MLKMHQKLYCTVRTYVLMLSWPSPAPAEVLLDLSHHTHMRVHALCEAGLLEFSAPASSKFATIQQLKGCRNDGTRARERVGKGGQLWPTQKPGPNKLCSDRANRSGSCATEKEGAGSIPSNTKKKSPHDQDIDPARCGHLRPRLLQRAESVAEIPEFTDPANARMN